MRASETAGRDRVRREVEHGRRLGQDAERIWGWGTAAGRLRRARRVEMIATAAELARSASVLELGCGTGAFTTAFAERAHLLVAIDVSSELLGQARVRGGSARYLLASAEQLPFPAAAFDAVIGSSVLHHLELEAVLPEIRRVLRANGRIAFTEPNFLNPQIALQKTIPPLKRWLGDSPDETAFFSWRIAATLRRHGFVTVRAEPFDFMHPLTPARAVGLMGRLGTIAERLPAVREIAGSLFITATTP